MQRNSQGFIKAIYRNLYGMSERYRIFQLPILCSQSINLLNLYEKRGKKYIIASVKGRSRLFSGHGQISKGLERLYFNCAMRYFQELFQEGVTLSLVKLSYDTSTHTDKQAIFLCAGQTGTQQYTTSHLTANCQIINLSQVLIFQFPKKEK